MTKSVVILSLLLIPTFACADTCVDGYTEQPNGDCIIHCDVGHRVTEPGGLCQPIMSGQYYVDTAHDVKYGDTSDAYVKRCPATADGRRGTTSSSAGNINGKSLNLCLVYDQIVRYDASTRGKCVLNSSDSISKCNYETHGVAMAPCYYTTGDDGNAIYDTQNKDPETGEPRSGCVGSTVTISCDAGYYTETPRSGNSPVQNPCSPVGTDYYSPDGDLERYPRPENTATCGYGDCAKSIDDCQPYKTLHAADNVSLMLQPHHRPSPALAVKTSDGKMWYADTDIGSRSGHINIMYNDTPYAVINPMDLFKTFTVGSGTITVPIHP